MGILSRMRQVKAELQAKADQRFKNYSDMRMQELRHEQIKLKDREQLADMEREVYRARKRIQEKETPGLLKVIANNVGKNLHNKVEEGRLNNPFTIPNSDDIRKRILK